MPALSVPLLSTMLERQFARARRNLSDSGLAAEILLGLDEQAQVCGTWVGAPNDRAAGVARSKSADTVLVVDFPLSTVAEMIAVDLRMRAGAAVILTGQAHAEDGRLTVIAAGRCAALGWSQVRAESKSGTRGEFVPCLPPGQDLGWLATVLP